MKSKRIRHQEQVQQRLLFRAAGERSIVELSNDTLMLKTTEYTTFEVFHEKFFGLFETLVELIPLLNQSVMKSAGLRYVDVIVPEGSGKLKDYIDNTFLPPEIITDGKHVRGQSLKVLKTAQNQTLSVHFEELPVRAKKIHKVLPDALMEQDPIASLIIDGHDSWTKV